MTDALANVVLLQAPGGPGDLFGAMLPFVAIFAIFYFLVIRPQSRRQKEHQEMLQSIQKGDSVVTSGGLHGRVTGTTDDVLTLEIAALRGERVRVKVDRARVERRVEAAKGAEE